MCLGPVYFFFLEGPDLGRLGGSCLSPEDEKVVLVTKSNDMCMPAAEAVDICVTETGIVFARLC